MDSLAEESYCYLTTTGRASGEPREIEIWFGLEESTLYMLSGGRDRSDWVKNLTKTPAVTVRIGDRSLEGRGRTVADPDEEASARRLLYEKYSPTYSGDLAEWRDSALPIAVDLDVGEGGSRSG
jgi:deazaflavin-dependent oxidoreductase (nitroreductase family)